MSPAQRPTGVHGRSGEQGDGDPRVERTRAAVLDAARTILLAEGQLAVTHLRVAESSGVGRATLYRHWPERTDLLIEALGTLTRPLQSSTGSVRADLLHELDQLRAELSNPELAPVLVTLVERSEWDTRLRRLKQQFVQRAASGLETILQRGAERGELVADVDTSRAVAQLAGPLFFRRLISDEPLTSALNEALVDEWLSQRTTH